MNNGIEGLDSSTAMHRRAQKAESALLAVEKDRAFWRDSARYYAKQAEDKDTYIASLKARLAEAEAKAKTDRIGYTSAIAVIASERDALAAKLAATHSCEHGERCETLAADFDGAVIYAERLEYERDAAVAERDAAVAELAKCECWNCDKSHSTGDERRDCSEFCVCRVNVDDARCPPCRARAARAETKERG